MPIKSIIHTVLLFSAACLSAVCADAVSTSDGANLLREGHSSRRTLSLDGQWQVAEGKSDAPPTVFAHTVPVPGLVSLAKPAFDAPGPKVADRQSLPQKDPKRDAFWYRRTFSLDGQVPVVALVRGEFVIEGPHNGDPAPLPPSPMPRKLLAHEEHGCIAGASAGRTVPSAGNWRNPSCAR